MSEMQTNSDQRSPQTEPCYELRIPIPGTRAQLKLRRTEEIRSHPSWLKNDIPLSVARLAAAAGAGDLAFEPPIITTHEGLLIDGYEVHALARQQGRTHLTALEYQIDEMEALELLLLRNRRSEGLNAFCRIVMALDRKQEFRQRAAANQSTGGREKGSSNLTKASHVDVRAEIARIAGSSSGTVNKVEALLKYAIPEVIAALRGGKITVHRASLWCKYSRAEQLCALRDWISEHAVVSLIQRSLGSGANRETQAKYDSAQLRRCLQFHLSESLEDIDIRVLDMPGKLICVTVEVIDGVSKEKRIV
jgi:hypothetical protein